MYNLLANLKYVERFTYKFLNLLINHVTKKIKDIFSREF